MVVELHEHQVPQLDVAVAGDPIGPGVAAVGAALRAAAASLGASVVVQLAAGAARALLAVDRWAPPVVVVAEPVDAALRNARLPPQLEGLVVGVVHGSVEPLRLQAQSADHQLQGELDGLGLEVVADAEVAQHLEERQVGRVADLLDVGRPERLLGGGQPPAGGRSLAGEVGLELHHPSDGQEHRRIAHRYQRGAGHPEVVLALEVAEKGLSYLVAGHGHGVGVTGCGGCDGRQSEIVEEAIRPVNCTYGPPDRRLDARPGTR